MPPPQPPVEQDSGASGLGWNDDSPRISPGATRTVDQEQYDTHAAEVAVGSGPKSEQDERSLSFNIFGAMWVTEGGVPAIPCSSYRRSQLGCLESTQQAHSRRVIVRESPGGASHPVGVLAGPLAEEKKAGQMVSSHSAEVKIYQI